MTGTFPTKIYKGLKEEYAPNLLDGNVLFKSISYFIRTEDKLRNDGFEGRHVDGPNHDVTLEVLTTGKRIKGQFEFHNVSGKPDRIFGFCTSMEEAVCAKFGGACVEIFDVQEFASRVEKALKRLARLIRLETPLLLARPVTYYQTNEPAPSHVNVKNANDLVFVKPTRYSSEKEFRFVFSRTGGRELVQKLVTKVYRPIDDIQGVIDREQLLKIGTIKDIARLM